MGRRMPTPFFGAFGFFLVEALTEDTDIPNPREHMAITRIQAPQKSWWSPKNGRFCCGPEEGWPLVAPTCRSWSTVDRDLTRDLTDRDLRHYLNQLMMKPLGFWMSPTARRWNMWNPGAWRPKGLRKTRRGRDVEELFLTRSFRRPKTGGTKCGRKRSLDNLGYLGYLLVEQSISARNTCWSKSSFYLVRIQFFCS